MIPVPAGKTLVKIEDSKFLSAYYIEYIGTDVCDGVSNFYAVLVDLLAGKSSIYYFERTPFTAIGMHEAVKIIHCSKAD